MGRLPGWLAAWLGGSRMPFSCWWTLLPVTPPRPAFPRSRSPVPPVGGRPVPCACVRPSGCGRAEEAPKHYILVPFLPDARGLLNAWTKISL